MQKKKCSWEVAGGRRELKVNQGLALKDSSLQVLCI